MTIPTDLRILHVLDHSLPVRDGYAFRSHAILATQKARGWQPYVVTSPKHHESDPGAVDTEVDGVPVFRAASVPAGPPLAGEWRLMRALERRLEEVAGRVQPHIIHAHSPSLNAWPAWRVARRLGVPVVYEVRASWEDAAVSSGKFTEGSLKYRLGRLAETLIARRVDHLTVLCEGLRRDFATRGVDATRITPIPNGVDVEQFVAPPRDESLARSLGIAQRPVVGFIGSFFAWEGLDLLVSALQILQRTHPDVVVLLVGSGEQREALQRQVDSLGLREHVVFAGSVPQQEVGRYYSLIDILAYPRHSSRLTELVTPLKPLEAMAMRKALVASDIGGHRELILPEQTGVLFPHGSKEALATALARLIDDPARRAELAAEGYRWVRETRTWWKTTEPLSAVYAKVLADRGATRGSMA